MNRWGKLMALSAAERALLRRSLFLLPMAAIVLRARGMGATQGLLQRLDQGRAAAPQIVPASEAARIVGAAAAFLGVGCLPRALVLCHLLRRGGEAPELCFGLASPGRPGHFAHAWVEVDGRPVNDSADVAQRYERFPPLSTKAR